MPPRSNNWDNFSFYLQWATMSMCTLLIQLSQAESASYSELSYMSAKLYISSVGWQCIVQGAICRGPWQLRLCIACKNATDIELHVHTYAVGVADIAASEGSPHNVLHSSSIYIYMFISMYCTSFRKFHYVQIIEAASILHVQWAYSTTASIAWSQLGHSPLSWPITATVS